MFCSSLELISGDAVYTVVISIKQGSKIVPRLVGNAPEQTKVQALMCIAKFGAGTPCALTAAKRFLDMSGRSTRAVMHTISGEQSHCARRLNLRRSPHEFYGAAV